MEEVKQARKKKNHNGLNYSSGLSSLRGCYVPGQWINYLPNLTYTYNPSTAPVARGGEYDDDDNNKLVLPYLRWKKVQWNSVNCKYTKNKRRVLKTCMKNVGNFQSSTILVIKHTLGLQNMPICFSLQSVRQLIFLMDVSGMAGISCISYRSSGDWKFEITKLEGKPFLPSYWISN